MASATRVKPCTFDEFSFLVKDGQKADLIDGVIYMASPDNTDANELFVWLLCLLHDFAEVRDLGKVFGSRVAFRINETNSPEPDIAFVSKQRLRVVRRGHVDGPPDLAIEIVSPESVERDYEQKRVQYERAAVREYWIVDELTEKVLLLRLDKKGKYREVRPRKGVLHSAVLAGFWLRPAWFWQKPRPKKTDVLAEVLA
jgi:Uma2 family endonuclease